MKIAYIAAGAAGMYCGSCLHDNTLARALLARGEDVILVPTYTPIRTDEQDVSHPQVFFGGINAYLQQSIPLFRYTPRWIDKWFDHPQLLNWVSKRGASVDPAKLGSMTVSMLRGEAGNQRKEVDKLVDWLIDEIKPDVVHLSNSMLLGMARRINQRCGPPVICSLSGEDIFIEKLTAPHYEQARTLLRERAAEVAGFTTLNGYYADFMADYLAIDHAKMHVVPHGLNLEGFGRAVSVSDRSPASEIATISGRSRSRLTNEEPIIGYLARICHDKGLHLLIEACEQLTTDRPDLKFNIQAAGYLGAGDKPYLAEIERRVAAGPLAGRFAYRGELDRAEKIAFLESLTLFSTPTVYQESKGLPAIEALAAGTPVLLPEHGSFPELIIETGGGLLHRPADPTHLAERLAEMLDNQAKTAGFGQTGQTHIHNHRHSGRMAEQTLEVYRKLTAPPR